MTDEPEDVDGEVVSVPALVEEDTGEVEVLQPLTDEDISFEVMPQEAGVLKPGELASNQRYKTELARLADDEDADPRALIRAAMKHPKIADRLVRAQLRKAAFGSTPAFNALIQFGFGKGSSTVEHNVNLRPLPPGDHTDSE